MSPGWRKPQDEEQPTFISFPEPREGRQDVAWWRKPQDEDQPTLVFFPEP